MSTTKTVRELDQVIIRFAGDSGDGMQLTGDRFTDATAAFGNDLATLPDFPAEIRAPAGTLFGVSGFQLNFADHDILTPGDAPNVLIAMNPAALKTNLGDLVRGGTLIVNTDAFEDRNLNKAGYETNPLTDGSLTDYQVFEIPLNSLTLGAVGDIEGIGQKDALRCKNMFALGLLSWMFSRPTDNTVGWLEKKFAKKPEILEANLRAFNAGYAFGETTEVFTYVYEVKPASLPPGTYRNISGNTALALGLVTAAVRSGIPAVLASYPITPASDILHEISRHKSYGIKTVQAEDEIAAAGMALGVSFAGGLGITTTSGPGVDLKAETIGLAVTTELPMVIVDIQRAGPSTGMPTKTEQGDLMLAMYGRHGESPLPIIAARSPSDCFFAAMEAVRIAIKFRTPVILLSDGFLANGSEPWHIPSVDSLPNIAEVVNYATGPNEGETFWPFKRDSETYARPWAIPGTPGLEHRIGGIEKKDGPGNISYDPANHERMTQLRQAKVAAVANDLPPTEVEGDADAPTLVLGWGSTYGAIRAACRRVRKAGHPIAHVHIGNLSPFPNDLGEILSRYERVLVPENNLGQLSRLIRAEYLVPTIPITQVNGLPFKAARLTEIFIEQLEGVAK